MVHLRAQLAAKVLDGTGEVKWLVGGIEGEDTGRRGRDQEIGRGAVVDGIHEVEVAGEEGQVDPMWGGQGGLTGGDQGQRAGVQSTNGPPPGTGVPPSR